MKTHKITIETKIIAVRWAIKTKKLQQQFEHFATKPMPVFITQECTSNKCNAQICAHQLCSKSSNALDLFLWSQRDCKGSLTVYKAY